MNPVPLELPVRAVEAVRAAEVVLKSCEGKQLNDDVRGRAGARLSTLGLTSVIAYTASLARDPTHSEAYYMAVDGLGAGARTALLLHMTLASSPTSALFPKPLLLARMRPAGSPEIVVNAIPFGPEDRPQIQTFVERVDHSFLPRAQGATPAVTLGGERPEVLFPAAFEAFRTILRTMAVNLASLSASRTNLYTAIWAAVRAGWREGFSLEAAPVEVSGTAGTEVARSIDAAQSALEQAAVSSRFVLDVSPLFQSEADERHPASWSNGEIDERFREVLGDGEQSWLEAGLPNPPAQGIPQRQLRRMAVKFARALEAYEVLHAYLKLLKSGSSLGRGFDCDVVLDDSRNLTLPLELEFCLHWLRARGRAPQGARIRAGLEASTPEQLEELRTSVAELAAVARRYNTALSVSSCPGLRAEVLSVLGRSTSSRLQFRERIEEAPASAEDRERIVNQVLWITRGLRT
jgi:hypothetical protein